MNKQAYENIVGMVLSKYAADEPVRAIKEAPVATTSSLISSTPSSLVYDVLSSPINLSSAGSASSGVGPGDASWIMKKNIYGKPGGALSMLFPNTASLYYGAFGDVSKTNEGLNKGFAELRKHPKYGPLLNQDNYRDFMKGIPGYSPSSKTIPIIDNADERYYNERRQEIEAARKRIESERAKIKAEWEEYRRKMRIK